MQHLREGLGWGAEVKAFPGCVVVGSDKVAESAVGQCRKVGFAGHEAPHPADGILDAALLPGSVGVTEEGLDGEAMQRQVIGELGAVVEGDGLTQRIRPIAFSMPPFCQGECGSQKKVSIERRCSAK